MKRVIGWIFFAVVAFGVGAGVGLGVSWGIMPSESKNTTPATLSQSSKDIYRSFIAQSFSITHDLMRAQIRLGLLDGDGALNAIDDQMNRSPQDQPGGTGWNSLMVLKDALINTQEISIPLAILPEAILQTPYVAITNTMRANDASPLINDKLNTSTSTPPVKPVTFTIRNRMQICDPAQQPSLLQVIVYDQSGKQKSGIVFLINSTAGSDRIVTGLKAERGIGYMDYQLTPGIVYSLTIEGIRGKSEEISAGECSEPDGRIYSGGLLLEIQY